LESCAHFMETGAFRIFQSRRERTIRLVFHGSGGLCFSLFLIWPVVAPHKTSP